MSNLSVRLPDEVERHLELEAEISGMNRSDLVREAIGEYLTRRERDRYMSELADEMREAYSDPAIRQEALELEQEGLEEWLESIEREERAAGIDPNEKWWD